MFLAVEPQVSRVYVQLQADGLLVSSKIMIRTRKIFLNAKKAIFRCAKALQHGQLGLHHRQRVLVAVCLE